MAKPQRIDYDKILFVGDLLCKLYKGTVTSTTREENHEDSDLRIELINGCGYGVEVKTVKTCYNNPGKYLYPEQNNNWIRTIGELNPKYRYWMLNAVDNSDYLGKGLKMLKDRNALVYIFMDGILFLPPTVFEDSIAGLGLYYTTQRQQFETSKLKKTPQWKLIINLEYGKWIPCQVPEEFFKQVNYNDFNRKNR